MSLRANNALASSGWPQSFKLYACAVWHWLKFKFAGKLVRVPIYDRLVWGSSDLAYALLDIKPSDIMACDTYFNFIVIHLISKCELSFLYILTIFTSCLILM